MDAALIELHSVNPARGSLVLDEDVLTGDARQALERVASALALMLVAVLLVRRLRALLRPFHGAARV